MQVVFHPDMIAKTSRPYGFPEAVTIKDGIEWLEREEDLKGIPYIVTVNGIPVMREEWDKTLPPRIDVMVLPGMTGLLIATLALTVISLGISAYLIITSKKSSTPSATGTLPTASDVFSFSGQSNTKKLNEPIELSYGRNRWYPSFYCLPIVEYKNNVAILHSWLSLGHGDLDVEKVNIVDTDITSIPGSTFALYAQNTHTPNSADGDFEDVIYLGDKTDVELGAYGSDKYETVEAMAAPAGGLIDTIQVNIAFNGGLYTVDSSGNAANASVSIAVARRRVDSLGYPLETWMENTYTYTSKQVTPQRYTITIPVSRNRFQVRVRRTSVAGTSGTDTATLTAIYGKMFSGQQAEVNILRVTLTGSNTIDTDSASKINVITQRKLYEIVNGVKTTSPLPTRSPIWAILDMLTSPQGGNIPWADVDLSYWENLANSISETFDTVFVNKTTVWEACQAAASVMKGTMYPLGSDLRLVIAQPNLIPVALFTPDNATDLSLATTFISSLDSDSVSATFVDPVTGLQDSVQFTPPGSEGVNPESLTLSGVTDRQLAWRLAAYRYQQLSLQRDVVTFSCGLDGLIPLLGDVIMVQWPFPAWASCGIIENAIVGIGTIELTLSDSIPNDSEWISFRMQNGNVYGPIPCALKSSTSVTIAAPCPITWSDLDQMAIIYAIGASSTFSRAFAVTSSQLSDGKVSVEATEYTSDLFAYDTSIVPAIGEDRLSYVGLTYVPWIKVEIDSSSTVRAFFVCPSGCTISFTNYRYIPLANEINLDPNLTDSNGDWIPVTNYNNQLYIPKSTGILEIQVIGARIVAGHLIHVSTYWRGIVATAEANSTAMVISCIAEIHASDPQVVEITDTTQTVGDRWAIYPIAAATASGKQYIHDITSKTTAQLQFRVDAAIAGPTKLTLSFTSPAGNIKTFTKYTDDKGFITFLKAELETAGFLYDSNVATAGGQNTLIATANVEGHDKPAFVLKSADSNQINLMLSIHDSPVITDTLSATAVSTGFNPGLNDYWTNLYGLTAIKHYVTIIGEVVDYPDAKVNWVASASDQLDTFAPVKVTPPRFYDTLQRTHLLTPSREITVAFLLRNASSFVKFDLSTGFIQLYTSVVGGGSNWAAGFLDENGGSIIPDSANSCFWCQEGWNDDTKKGWIYIYTCNSSAPGTTNIALTEAEKTRLAKAFKVYKLYADVNPSLPSVTITATPKSAYGVNGNSGIFVVSSAS